MKLRSLLGDDRIVAFDCAKTKIGGETKVIDIPDACWATSEVQNALSQGLVELVGDPPMMTAGTQMPAERKIKFRNYHMCRLTFECLKAGVDPEEFINIPTSLVDTREVSNAISAGWLVNMEEPVVPQGLSTPVVLDEVGIRTSTNAPVPTTNTPSPSKARAMAVAGSKQQKTAAEPIKAKPITKADDEDEDLYKPSVVKDAPPKKKKKRVVIETPVEPEVEEGAEDPFKPSEVKLPEARGPADISSLFTKKGR